VCIGTGPSLTMQQVEIARKKGYTLAGCNRVGLDVPDLAVLYGCNYDFWAVYADRLKGPAEKWTTNRVAAETFWLNWIDEKDAQGLSTDLRYVHHGHGSGYSLVNLVYLLGATRIVLLGYDCKYAHDYDGKQRTIGSLPRHYFGEYEPELQHWPSVSVREGVHVQLVELYKSVARQAAVEIINCTPDSAIECFPQVNIAAL
jgi:hypothetical protein